MLSGGGLSARAWAVTKFFGVMPAKAGIQYSRRRK
jgi:hypothetical protein